MINILLVATTDKLQLITSSAATIDVVAAFMDMSNADPPVVKGSTSSRQNTAISSAATTDIVAAPAASTLRNVKGFTARNKSAATASDVTVQFNQNGTLYEMYKVTLLAGQTLEFIEGIGFFTLGSATGSLTTESTSSQTGFSSDTYLTGSSIAVPSSLPIVGTAYFLRFDVTKTGAGTATPIINIRFGTAGAIGDTSRCSFTFGAGSAAIDTAIVNCLCIFRTVGSGTSSVMQGQSFAQNTLASTGWTTVVKAVITTGGGFDSTVANSFIGASYNGGASAAHTIQLVRAELVA